MNEQEMNQHRLVQTSYRSDEVTFLLRALDDAEVNEVSIAEKEAHIRNGGSYASVLSRELPPNATQQALLEQFWQTPATDFAQAIAQLATKIIASRGEAVVLVSLARAGTPIGILIARYAKQYFGLTLPHYSISIIRGQGIDAHALATICARHPHAPIQFVDGWTGKGSIIDELTRSLAAFVKQHGRTLPAHLAVIADPARRCELAATQADIVIPNCYANATLSGLISRTVLPTTQGYHGAKYLADLADFDCSQRFLDHVSAAFRHPVALLPTQEVLPTYAQAVTKAIQAQYEVVDRHKIKLSIGEAMRVLLRRQARCVLVKDETHPEVVGLVALARAKAIPVYVETSALLQAYEAAAIIDA